MGNGSTSSAMGGAYGGVAYTPMKIGGMGGAQQGAASMNAAMRARIAEQNKPPAPTYTPPPTAPMSPASGQYGGGTYNYPPLPPAMAPASGQFGGDFSSPAYMIGTSPTQPLRPDTLYPPGSPAYLRPSEGGPSYASQIPDRPPTWEEMEQRDRAKPHGYGDIYREGAIMTGPRRPDRYGYGSMSLTGKEYAIPGVSIPPGVETMGQFEAWQRQEEDKERAGYRSESLKEMLRPPSVRPPTVSSPAEKPRVTSVIEKTVETGPEKAYRVLAERKAAREATPTVKPTAKPAAKMDEVLGLVRALQSQWEKFRAGGGKGGGDKEPKGISEHDAKREMDKVLDKIENLPIGLVERGAGHWGGKVGNAIKALRENWWKDPVAALNAANALWKKVQVRNNKIMAHHHVLNVKDARALKGMSGGGGSGMFNKANAEAARRNWEEAMRLLEEARDAIANNPLFQKAEELMMAMMSGEGLPFNDQVKAQIFGGISDTLTRAMQERIRVGEGAIGAANLRGGAPTSYTSAMMGDRATADAAARAQEATRMAQANAAAKQQAVSQASAVAAQQAAQANAVRQQMAQMHATRQYPAYT